MATITGCLAPSIINFIFLLNGTFFVKVKNEKIMAIIIEKIGEIAESKKTIDVINKPINNENGANCSKPPIFVFCSIAVYLSY